MFRGELLAAFKILQTGIRSAQVLSSGGGAMGLTQFLPSESLKYAFDVDGVGRAVIWNSVPVSLASAATHLQGKTWQPVKAWACGEPPPANIDCVVADRDNLAPLGDWLKRGYAPAYGRKVLPNDVGDNASLLMPAGIYGPSFLIMKNYYVIKDYNFS